MYDYPQRRPDFIRTLAAFISTLVVIAVGAYALYSIHTGKIAIPSSLTTPTAIVPANTINRNIIVPPLPSNPRVANSDAESQSMYQTAVAKQNAPAQAVDNVYNPDKPALPAAIPIPPISAEQAANYASRGSGTCPAGQVFVARVGCHTPGSGGAMPGAVTP